MLIDNLINKRKNKKITFKDISIEWLTIKKKSIKKSTYYNYLYKIEKVLFPYLKETTVEELENYNFEDLIEKLRQTLAPKTVSDILIILKSVLEYSVNRYGCNVKVKNIKA